MGGNISQPELRDLEPVIGLVSHAQGFDLALRPYAWWKKFTYTLKVSMTLRLEGLSKSCSFKWPTYVRPHSMLVQDLFHLSSEYLRLSPFIPLCLSWGSLDPSVIH